MKRILIILIILCPYAAGGIMQAQLYRTSNAEIHSYSSGGVGVMAPSTADFRSTSAYGIGSVRMPMERTSVAPMHVANGAVRTVASSIKGGVLLEDSETESGYISPIRKAPVIPGVPDTNPTPIGDGWDVALLLAMLCVAYGIYLKRKC